MKGFLFEGRPNIRWKTYNGIEPSRRQCSNDGSRIQIWCITYDDGCTVFGSALLFDFVKGLVGFSKGDAGRYRHIEALSMTVHTIISDIGDYCRRRFGKGCQGGETRFGPCRNKQGDIF